MEELSGINELFVVIFIILFPGIIATMISDKIVYHVKPWDSFKYGLYSFIFGIFCYGLLQIISWILQTLPCQYGVLSFLKPPLDSWKIIYNSKEIDFKEIFAATILSIPVACFFAFIINYKVINKLAQKLKISNKYGDESLYLFYINSQQINWVYVRDFERKLTYQGIIYSYNETDTNQELVLSNVTVYGYENSEEYYSVPSIYICRTHGSIVIESIPEDILINVEESINDEESNNQ